MRFRLICVERTLKGFDRKPYSFLRKALRVVGYTLKALTLPEIGTDERANIYGRKCLHEHTKQPTRPNVFRSDLKSKTKLEM